MTDFSALEVLDPVAAPVIEPGQPAARLDSLDGKRVGLYGNLKIQTLELLAIVEEILSSRFRIQQFVRGTYNPTRLMRPEEWVGVDDCDAMLLTHGD
jgi:hypothetical protein